MDGYTIHYLYSWVGIKLVRSGAFDPFELKDHSYQLVTWIATVPARMKWCGQFCIFSPEMILTGLLGPFLSVILVSTIIVFDGRCHYH